MRTGYRRRKYNWNLFGKQYGINIIKRLDWINGKPMVWIAMLNLFILIVNSFADKNGADIPEVYALTSCWGWGLFNVLAKITFWVLFADGVIVRFLWSFTRGAYFCPYLKRIILLPNLDNRADVKEELAWATFLFTHPEFDYKLQELTNKYAVELAMTDFKADSEGYARERMALMREYGVVKDEKGKYFSWNDKKAQKFLERL